MAKKILLPSNNGAVGDYPIMARTLKKGFVNLGPSIGHEDIGLIMCVDDGDVTINWAGVVPSSDTISMMSGDDYTVDMLEVETIDIISGKFHLVPRI